MAKIQKISDIQPTLGFTEFDIMDEYRKSFASSELGRLHGVFPFKELARSMCLKGSRLGRKSHFSAEGKIALMVLKSYTGFSDRALIGHLNGNIHYQLFCGLRVSPLDGLSNYKIVSAIRNELAGRLDIGALQEILAARWTPYLSDTHVCMTDATCYESHMRFPTDVKLLWESVEWLHRHQVAHCRDLRLRRPRNKYDDVSRAYLAYSKKRKRGQSHTRMLKRRLIRLLDKLIWQTDALIRLHGRKLRLSPDYKRRLSVVRKVYGQEKELFEGRKVSDRVVSLDRHYIRPIVRGKETKKVEFGAKVNNIQIDGISFIDRLSFKAFNEGTRLRDCVRLQQRLTKRRVRCVAADSIYATNANRKFCTRYGIHTSFVRKGAAAKDESQRKTLRSALGRERATRLEGSFGTQKQRYSLAKIKARNSRTETLWIFFGIHTANAVCMTGKVMGRESGTG
jgi:hypothetical protein